MTELPTGTVTFLFTDIEGSTELVRKLGPRYTAVLERHNEILRAAFAAQRGVEVMSEGDALFAVFTSPNAAAQAAADGQRALHAETWPENADVRVRMGLHSGEGILGGDNYVGLDVHRAARIAAAGHGGQVLISDATRALVELSLPAGAALRYLGQHRLKGLPAAERIYQLTLEDLPSDFPPISSLESRPNNLPPDATSFIGRERQLHELRERLAKTRLLTLTGPGGSGKTRLAIRTAEDVIGDYEQGCWFVALDALRDSELVPASIAAALGIRAPGDTPVMHALEAWLAERELLLVLDNFEQVRAAAAYVSHLLSAAPRLRVLATSRAPLHIYGEHEYPVPPLATGSAARGATAPTPESLSQYEAVRLFVERALAVMPDFRVTNDNAPAVAEICGRLDGLPLAIELAAARVKLLSPEQMLSRLERNLSLLASSAQDLPERQRTLLGAIDWSHDLLSREQQMLFARLSIFRGGCTLEAAEQVCAGEAMELDVFAGVESLLDMSLLRSDEREGERRIRMLETVREYARQRLVESGEMGQLVARHAAYFFAMAADAERGLEASDQVEWLERLEREHDNLRAAFSRVGGVGMLDEALTAAGAIWRFWQLRGHFAEGRSILERLLAEEGGSAQARAKALTGAGGIAYWQGDYEAMAAEYREARELYESLGDPNMIALAISNESYIPTLLHGDLDAARKMIERALELYRRAGNELGVAEMESSLGFTHFFQGDPEATIPFQERAVAAYRAAGTGWQLSENLLGLGYLYAQTGNWPVAHGHIRESLALARELRIELGEAMVLEVVGAAAAWVGEAALGARLLGRADSMKGRLGGGAPSQLVQTEPARDRARTDLGEERYEQLHSEGAQLSSAEAFALADSFEPSPDSPPLPRPTPWGVAAGSGEGEAPPC